jgi:hypothetical protein
MEIKSFAELEALENRIRTAIQHYKLEQVLVGLRQVPASVEPFMLAGVSLFALRFCKAGERVPRVQSLTWPTLAPLIDLVTQYYLADPLGFDEDLQRAYSNSNSVFAFLRIVASQFPFDVSPFGQHAQPLLLYHEIPKLLATRPDVPRFDFERSFLELVGVPFLDFLLVGFTAYVAAQRNHGFTRGYFAKAREQGIALPSDQDLLPILERLAADPSAFRASYEQHKVPDRRFAVYDFNPLFLRPLVRPWTHHKSIRMEQDRFIAPLPHLILHKISTGIYYEMFNRYKEDFSKYFGYLFEAYIGYLLQKTIASSHLMSEADIRKTYPTSKGKVPDWVILDGSTAICLECKATRFTRAAVTAGGEDAIRHSIKQVVKGLMQLHDFIEACRANRDGLEAFQVCTSFKPVLVTHEPFHLINSSRFRDFIDSELLLHGITNLPWYIVPVDALERLQPYLANGVGFSSLIEQLERKPLATLLEELHTETGLTFKDSFLYEMDKQLYQRLGVADASTDLAGSI